MKQEKYCPTCNKKLSKFNKTGFCNHHRNRSGINNPFFGKKHSSKTKEHLSHTSRQSTKALWQTDQYRNNVIEHATGKKRSEQFKTEQSKRIEEWYKKNPEQRIIRSKYMKRSWCAGKIKPTINSINESKIEKELFETIQQLLPNRNVIKKTIRIKEKWFYPDILIDGKYIIEFYGDFWHANPNKFKEEDIIHHSITAKEQWMRDQERNKILTENGYQVYIIWQYEYENNKNETLERILKNFMTYTIFYRRRILEKNKQSGDIKYIDSSVNLPDDESFRCEGPFDTIDKAEKAASLKFNLLNNTCGFEHESTLLEFEVEGDIQIHDETGKIIKEIKNPNN